MLCFGKQRIEQLRTHKIKSHQIQLYPDLELYFDVQQFRYISSNKQNLQKGQQMVEDYKFNKLLNQQILDQNIEIQEMKIKRQKKLEQMQKLEKDILNMEINKGVVQILLKDDQVVFKNLKQYEFKYVKNT